MDRSRITLMLVLVLAAMTFTMCCKRTGTAGAASPPIKTGIVGRVEVWEGNFMPPVPPERRDNQIKPGVGRRVRVYEPVKVAGGLAETKRAQISTPLVAEAVSDSAGRFTVAVPPGTYSVFVEEDSSWYANGFNLEGIQGAVTVQEGKLTETLLKITTKATF